MLKAIGQNAQSQRLDSFDRILPCCSISKHARQGMYLREPTAVVFPFDFNDERHQTSLTFNVH